MSWADGQTMLERIAANAERVLDALVVEYVDAVPHRGRVRDREAAAQAIGGIGALLRCAAGGAPAGDPTVQRVLGELVEAERARRDL